MFSTDKNIESIAELVEALKKHGTLWLEHARYSVVDKVVRIFAMLVLALIVMLSVVLMLILASIAAALAIGTALDSMISGFLIVALCHFILLSLVFILRKSLIEKPLVRFLVTILLG